jgi:hypothetical protein
MNSTYGTIILALIASMVCIILPTATIAYRQDESENQVVRNAITKFGEEVCETSVITSENYANLKAELDATNNSYDLQITVSHMDENLAKKDTTTEKDQIKIGENIYYNEYTYQIESQLDQNEKIQLTQGDYILIVAENNNQTMYQAFRKLLYGIVDQEKAIQAQYSGMVLESY